MTAPGSWTGPPSGQASTIWYAAEQTATTVRSAFRSGPVAVWRALSAFTPTAPPGWSVLGIHVAADAAGDAVAAWSVLPNGGTTGSVCVATRVGRGAWTAQRAMSDTDVAVGGRGVALRVSWVGGGSNLIWATPSGRPTTLGRAWALGTIAPGHSASVRVVVRAHHGWDRYAWGQTAAAGRAAHTFQVTAPA